MRQSQSRNLWSGRHSLPVAWILVARLAKSIARNCRRNGNAIIPTPVGEILLNLDNLRRYLTRATLACRMLPEGVIARQKLLEMPAHGVAAGRLKREVKIFGGIGSSHADVPVFNMQTYKDGCEIGAETTYRGCRECQGRCQRVETTRCRTVVPFACIC